MKAPQNGTLMTLIARRLTLKRRSGQRPSAPNQRHQRAIRLALRPTLSKRLAKPSRGILALVRASPVNTKSLAELVQQLPPDAQEVVRDLVELLLVRPGIEATPQPSRFLRQDWAGALRAYRHQYSSLDFQHRASDWRISESE